MEYIQINSHFSLVVIYSEGWFLLLIIRCLKNTRDIEYESGGAYYGSEKFWLGN